MGSRNQRTVDLGFAPGRLPVGTHICQIYNHDDERNAAIEAFLLAGLRDGERTACFSEKVAPEALGAWLGERGVSLRDALDSGALTLAGTSDVYFAEGVFDPDRMLTLLVQFHEDAQRAGQPAARVIGEMSPEIDRIPGGSRLMEYESRVGELLLDHPVTAVCQYHAHAFDGATIMDVLRVHPMMLIRGQVVNNPFFVPPALIPGR